MPERILPQTRVRFRDRTGTTCTDFMNCCAPWETPVVFDGTEEFEGVATESLIISGPEDAVADVKKCGGGRGEECCIFLTFGPEGAACQRFSGLRYTLIFKEQGSKRSPLEPFPKCQLPESAP